MKSNMKSYVSLNSNMLVLIIIYARLKFGMKSLNNNMYKLIITLFQVKGKLFVPHLTQALRDFALRRRRYSIW